MHAYAATHTENDRNHWIQEISLDLKLALKTPTSEPRSPQDPTPQPSSSPTTTGPSGLTVEVSPHQVQCVRPAAHPMLVRDSQL